MYTYILTIKSFVYVLIEEQQMEELNVVVKYSEIQIPKGEKYYVIFISSK